MKTIAFLNQKGGCGKTTISVNVACCLKNRGYSVLLVDSDPQGSARDWNEENGGEVLTVVGLDRKTLAKDVEPFKNQYDYIVIDGAPQVAALAGEGVKAADLVLIPVQPSPYDIWSCGELVDVIKTRQSITDGKPQACFLVSRAIKNTKLGNDVAETLAGYELPVLESLTTQRVAYPTTASKGQSVFASDDKEAKAEIEAITNEILERL